MTSKKKADMVHDAIAILQRFFELRRIACAGTSADTIAAEAKLFQKFSDFGDAMEAHRFELDMDAGLRMPDITRWHDIAVPAAAAFRLAMMPKNPGVRFGPTSDGPLPRFLAEVLPLITGEAVTPAAVGKFLRREAKRRTAAPPGRPVPLTAEDAAWTAEDEAIRKALDAGSAWDK